MLDRLADAVRSLIPVSDIDPGVPVLDESEFDERIRADEPVAVLFYADWCGFCRAYADTFREEVGEVDLPVVAANISDESDERWTRHDVEAVPTLVAFRGGQVQARVDARPGKGLSEGDLASLERDVEA